jgi:hypothetical protein
MILITKDNYHQVIGDGHSVEWNGEKRYFGRAPRKTPINRLVEGAAEMPLELIPFDEVCDRIEQKDKEKSWAFDTFHRGGNKVLDQNGFSLCHSFSGADAMMIRRAAQGLPYVELSAGYLGGLVTGHRNAGAAIEDVLRVMREQGIASTEFCGMMQIDSNYKPGAADDAKLHRVSHFWDLSSREMLQQNITVVLEGFGPNYGYDWWGHAVTGTRIAPRGTMSELRDAFKSGNVSRILAAMKTQILNTWNTTYGDQGFGWITDDKQLPNEAYVIAQVTVSNK